MDGPPVPSSINAQVFSCRKTTQPVTGVAPRDTSQGTGSVTKMLMRKYFRQTKLGNSSGRRKRVGQEQFPASTSIPHTAEVLLWLFFKTNYTQKPLMEFTTLEKIRMRKWATAHPKYKALMKAFCKILF